jgi:hypothetical protein
MEKSASERTQREIRGVPILSEPSFLINRIEVRRNGKIIIESLIGSDNNLRGKASEMLGNKSRGIAYIIFLDFG